eukprot:COSAG05_NODE_21147_length_274_cov_0.588571_1_plen_42_part_01
MGEWVVETRHCVRAYLPGCCCAASARAAAIVAVTHAYKSATV